MPNRRINLPKFADQPNLVYASQLVKEYARTLAFELFGRPYRDPRIRPNTLAVRTSYVGLPANR